MTAVEEHKTPFVFSASALEFVATSTPLAALGCQLEPQPEVVIGQPFRENGRIFVFVNRTITPLNCAPYTTPMREEVVPSAPALPDSVFTDMRELYFLRYETQQMRAQLTAVPKDLTAHQIGLERALFKAVAEQVAAAQKSESAAASALLPPASPILMVSKKSAKPTAVVVTFPAQVKRPVFMRFIVLSEADMRAVSACQMKEDAVWEQRKTLASLAVEMEKLVVKLDQKTSRLDALETQLKEARAIIMEQTERLRSERKELALKVDKREAVNLSNQTLIEAHILRFLLMNLNRHTYKHRTEEYQKKRKQHQKAVDLHNAKAEESRQKVREHEAERAQVAAVKADLDAKIEAIRNSLADAQIVAIPDGRKGLMVAEPDFLGILVDSLIFVTRPLPSSLELEIVSRKFQPQICEISQVAFEALATKRAFTKDEVRALYEAQSVAESASCFKWLCC